jgi:hypothetical protein
MKKLSALKEFEGVVKGLTAAPANMGKILDVIKRYSMASVLGVISAYSSREAEKMRKVGGDMGEADILDKVSSLVGKAEDMADKLTRY